MTAFKNWKIKQKVNLLTFFAPVAFFLLIFFYLIPQAANEIFHSKELEIKHIVETAHGVFNHYYDKYKTGEISEEEAKNLSLSSINSLRFDHDNYFFIIDKDAKMVNHPFNKELNGKSVRHIKDADGKPLFIEFVDIANKQGEGFSEYKWTRPGKSKAVTKEAYLKSFDKWSWIIGSGIYLDDVEEEIASLKWKLTLIIIIISAIVILTGFYISKLLTEPVLKLSSASKEIVNGNYDVTVEKGNEDELGELSASFNSMVEKIQMQIGYLENLPTPVMLIDTEFNVQYMNKYGANLLGETQEKLYEQKCYDLFKTDHCNTDECRCKQAMEMNEVRAGETTSHAAEEDIHITYTGSAIKDRSGKIVGALEYIANITEIKDLQNYLNRSSVCMMEAMESFSQGDLTIQVDCEKKGDDISRLFESFNTSVNSVNDMITRVSEAIEATSSASSEISSSTEQMAAGAQEQSSQTHEVASAIEQMSKTIIETAQSSNEAASASKEAQDETKNGAGKITETKEGMEKIVTATKETGKIIKELTGKTDQIGEITQVIDDIADQTNLLALNAAIEAARAGEQGRGFAVVADEVRKLAERTTKATKEIAETIKAIQIDVKEADTSMSLADEAVLNGMALTEEVANVFNLISDKSGDVSQSILQVASASEEQSVTAEEISKNIEGITNVTNESAAAIQQVASTAEDLNRLTHNLNDLITQFKLQENNSLNKLNQNATNLLA